LYPDVYDRGTRTIQAVRQELAAAGVASSDLDDAAIKQMMDRVTRGEEFAVSLNDLREGRGVEAGANQSLRLDSPEKKKSSRRAKLD
ncbi:MAG: hypothetical protein JO317_08040, partial [Verrucomicrobiae bacterium]|nr:hypothetical protein [Verrucomicrobiae bacterium]